MVKTFKLLACTAAVSLVSLAAQAGNSGTFDATLQVEGKDICSDLNGLESSQADGNATYVFTNVSTTTGMVMATGNTATIGLTDSNGGTVLCTGPTLKRVFLQSENGGLVPSAANLANIDTTLFAAKITYQITNIDWGPDTFIALDPETSPISSANLTTRMKAYEKKGAAQGNVEVSLELDATSMPLVAVTYEDVLTITVTDDDDLTSEREVAPT